MTDGTGTPFDPTAQRPSAPQPGAICAQHPGVLAHAVCRRCGNYMCSVCSHNGTASQCIECRQRTGSSTFPFSRDRFELGALMDFVWQRWKLKWQSLTIVSVAFMGVLYGVSFLGSLLFMVPMMIIAGAGARGAEPDPGPMMGGMLVVQGIMYLVQMVLQLWLTMGFFVVAIDVLEGRDADVKQLFSRLRQVPAALLQLLVIYVAWAALLSPAVAAYFLVPGDEDTRLAAAVITGAVLMLPLIYVSMGIGLATIELSYNPSATAIGALRTSFQLVDGHRLQLVGMGLVAFGTIMVGFLLCCVGVIPAYGLAALFMCSLYLALRTPTPAT